MGNGKVPHRRRRHLQQQGGQQAQDALMADDQQVVKMAAVGQRGINSLTRRAKF
ncbi:Uncharacterised protein [Klebsiella pneumoniae]|uniref:Uncharacterized protein n=1 Tax=Klebsiella pneumoniae TaxID=573 RepID=A0A378FNT4_KLEPN|nr:Uncharacterised protein [Klebsiella pneumoniae]